MRICLVLFVSLALILFAGCPKVSAKNMSQVLVNGREVQWIPRSEDPARLAEIAVPEMAWSKTDDGAADMELIKSKLAQSGVYIRRQGTDLNIEFQMTSGLELSPTWTEECGLFPTSFSFYPDPNSGGTLVVFERSKITENGRIGNNSDGAATLTWAEATKSGSPASLVFLTPYRKGIVLIVDEP